MENDKILCIFYDLSESCNFNIITLVILCSMIYLKKYIQSLKFNLILTK